MPASRGALNVVLDGVIYQRGQILTWQRAKKYAMLEEYNIRTVVNFWPKIDPDMAGGCDAVRLLLRASAL
jgi:hypothetical protein